MAGRFCVSRRAVPLFTVLSRQASKPAFPQDLKRFWHPSALATSDILFRPEAGYRNLPYANRLVAEGGLEPPSSWLWAKRATYCSTPRSFVSQPLNPVCVQVNPASHAFAVSFARKKRWTKKVRSITFSATLLYHILSRLSIPSIAVFPSFLEWEYVGMCIGVSQKKSRKIDLKSTPGGVPRLLALGLLCLSVAIIYNYINKHGASACGGLGVCRVYISRAFRRGAVHVGACGRFAERLNKPGTG